MIETVEVDGHTKGEEDVEVEVDEREAQED
jgi:hypothetical protein